MPEKPIRNPEWIFEGKDPIDNEIYINIRI